MKKILPATATLIGILAVGTIVEGTLSERWVKMRSQKLEEFALNIDDVPKTFGHWVGVDDEVTEEKKEEFKASNCRSKRK